MEDMSMMSWSSVNKSSEDSVDEKQADDVRQALAMFVCHSRIAPRSVCNGSPFSLSNIILAHNPNPKMYSCFEFETLESNCLNIYDAEKEKVKEIFSELGGKICLSVETLVDMKRLHEFFCLSAQFINNDWKLQKWVIKFDVGFPIRVPSRVIMQALKEYNIESKIHTLTVGETTDLADVVKKNVQKQIELPMGGQLFNVQCCCDVLTRMAETGFEEISEIISKVELLSWSKSEPLWYLTTSKLSSALELNELGEFKSAEEDDFYEVPSKEEWERVRSVCNFTERIYEITHGLFENTRPTANLFLPHMQEIRAYLTAESTSSDAFASLVAQKMLEIFNKYWNDTCLMLSIAAFLDPRYKLEFVEFCLSGSKVGDTVIENIRKIYDGYGVLCDQKEYLLSDSGSDIGEDEEEEEDDDEEEEEKIELFEKKVRPNILEKLNVLQEYCQSTRSKKTQKSDLELYLEEPTLAWVEHFSVLKWWKDNCTKYPQLSRMARDFLAIPMSVTTSYEAYYTEPREIDPTVMCPKLKLINALMCTRSWKLDSKE